MDYSSITSSPDAITALGAIAGLALGVLIFALIITLATIILMVIGQWHIFKKAGEPGWAALIPFYNIFVLIKVAKLEWWHFLIYFGLMVLTNIDVDTISLISSFGVIAYYFVINIRIAQAFGKSTGFGVLTSFFPYIGYMILGCSSAAYQE